MEGFNSPESCSLDDLTGLNQSNKLKGRFVNHYLVSEKDIGDLIKIIKYKGFLPLVVDGESRFNFSSQYFDFKSYFMSINGNTRLRTRAYPNGHEVFECKISQSNGVELKERIEERKSIPPKSEGIILPEDLILAPLSKTIQTVYTRESFIRFNSIPTIGGEENVETKVTLDFSLVFNNHVSKKTVSLGNCVIVEVKSFDGNSDIDREFKKLGVSPNNNFSKLQFGLDVTDPKAVPEARSECSSRIFDIFGGKSH